MRLQLIDIDERVAWNENCDFPMAGQLHALFLTKRVTMLFLGINQHALQLTMSSNA